MFTIVTTLNPKLLWLHKCAYMVSIVLSMEILTNQILMELWTLRKHVDIGDAIFLVALDNMYQWTLITRLGL
jgi:hypothetical protein